MTTHTHFTSPFSTIMRLPYSGLLAALLGLVTLLIFPAVAFAQATHAEYVSSDPTANAVLTKAPATIKVTFSEELDPNGSTLQVYDIDNKPVSQKESVQVDRNDVKTMTVTLQPSNSEVYVVNWYTIASDDQHHDAGSFRFFVNPNPMLAEMIRTNGTSGETHTSSSGGLPVWSAALIGVVALLVGGLVGGFAVQRFRKK